jgi:outer membrane protein, heavy metal efflux system
MASLSERSPWCRSALWCGALLLSGCVSSRAGQQEVQSGVQQRLGAKLALESEEEGRRHAARLLARPLDAESAAQIALLRSPRATLALGKLEQGRAVAMGMYRLPNPHAELAARFGGGESSPTLDVGATLDLTELVILGYRAPAADAELHAAQAEALRELLVLAHHAKRAFYTQQANLQAARLEAGVFAAVDAQLATARAMHAAGNSTDLEFALQEAAASEASLRLADVNATVRAGTEQLRQALGLWQAEDEFELKPELPELPKQEPPWAHAEQRAVATNLDIEAAAQRKLSAEEQHDGAWLKSVVPRLGAGVGAEREEGEWSVGPVVELEVPLFYQGQAERAATQAAVGRHEAERRDAAIGVRAESRAVLERLRSSRSRVQRYETELLPKRREILKQALLQYNAMSIGVFQLLEARRALTLAELGRVTALRDYWLARTDLSQLLAGSRLGQVSGTAPAAPGGATATGSAGAGGH